MPLPPFTPPGPGTWELERTHVSRPVTRLMAETLPDAMASGFAEGTARYGLTLSHFRTAAVNGFLYMKAVPAGAPEDADGPPPAGFFESPFMKERFEACRRAFESRAWLEDLRRWDEEVKPDSIARNRRLLSVDLASLDDAALAAHLEACRANAAEMFRRHHVFSATAIIPVGHLLANAAAWTGRDPGDLAVLLKGSSPVSRGPVRELERLSSALKSAGIRPEELDSGAAGGILEALRNRTDDVRAPLEAYLEIAGHSLVYGYDVCDPTGLELPNLLVGAMRTALADGLAAGDDDSWRAQAERVRAAVPAAHRAAFDTMLEDARRVNRIRDERGVYNEQWGIGIWRLALLEAGRRLARRGLIEDPGHAVEPSHAELLSLLGGEGGPSPAELRDRARFRTEHTLDEAPEWLNGPPPPPPPLEAIPEAGRPGAIAVGTAISQVFDVAQTEAPEPAVLQGLAVSPGVYQGPARVILRAEDLARLRQGEVLVTTATSAAFNVVLPLVGAIVTDRGGRLSHAAIVAREYGIPAVVGTRTATSAIRDGVRVRVDGSSGKVETQA